MNYNDIHVCICVCFFKPAGPCISHTCVSPQPNDQMVAERSRVLVFDLARGFASKWLIAKWEAPRFRVETSKGDAVFPSDHRFTPDQN